MPTNPRLLADDKVICGFGRVEPFSDDVFAIRGDAIFITLS